MWRLSSGLALTRTRQWPHGQERPPQTTSTALHSAHVRPPRTPSIALAPPPMCARPSTHVRPHPPPMCARPSTTREHTPLHHPCWQAHPPIMNGSAVVSVSSPLISAWLARPTAANASSAAASPATIRAAFLRGRKRTQALGEGIGCEPGTLGVGTRCEEGTFGVDMDVTREYLMWELVVTQERLVWAPAMAPAQTH
eukprot:365315-Chlamydomonas_euryale.AAC.14